MAARGGVRPARHRPDRPRGDERGGRALQGLQEGGGSSRFSASKPTWSTTSTDRGGPLRAQPPHAARLHRRGLPQPRQAHLGGLPRGLQAGQGPTSTKTCCRATPRTSSSSRAACSRAFAAASWTTTRRRRALHVDDLMHIYGPENVYFELQAQRHRGPGQGQRGHRARGARGRAAARGTADVHYLRREDYHHHAALLCVQTKSTLAEPKLSFDTNEFFLKDNDEMAGLVRRPGREANADHARGGRALPGRPSAGKPAHPALPGAGRAAGGRVPARAGRRRPAPAATAIRRRPRRSSGSRPELEVIGRMGFDAYFLIVWDFVKFAKDNGIAGPGARLGGRLDRLLRAEHHRRRPAGVRPALRALPQRRARLDAGHRHRLLV